MKKFFKKNKKLLIICGFCCLLVIAGVLNLVINSNTAKGASGEVVTTANFFTTYKADRLNTNAQEKLYLEAIISNANSSAEAKANAEAELAKLTKYMGLQTKLEGLIAAKGFSQVAVSASDSNVSVIVQTSGLSENDLANIVEVVQTNSDYGLENIKIIPVE